MVKGRKFDKDKTQFINELFARFGRARDVINYATVAYYLRQHFLVKESDVPDM